MWAQFKGIKSLLAGNAFISAVGMVTVATTARHLGTENFGILAIGSAVALVLDRLISFQTWQPAIKYGAPALDEGRVDDLKSLLKGAFLLDTGTGLLASAVCGGLAAALYALGIWPPSQAAVVGVYSVSLAFSISGAPIAALRLLGLFSAYAVQQSAVSAFKLALTSLTILAGGSLYAITAAWVASEVTGKISLIWLARSALSRRGISRVHGASLRNFRQRFQGITAFLRTATVHSSAKMALKEADILLVGHMLGPAGAGVYKIVKLIGSATQKVSDPLMQVVYPNLARAVARRDAQAVADLVFRPMRTLALISAGLLFVFIVAGGPAIRTLLGNDYDAAYLPTIPYIAASSLAVVTFGLHPALLSLGRPEVSLRILLVSTAVYLVVLVPLTHGLGLLGCALSYLIFYVSWAGMQITAIRRELSQL